MLAVERLLIAPTSEASMGLVGGWDNPAQCPKPQTGRSKSAYYASGTVERAVEMPVDFHPVFVDALSQRKVEVFEEQSTMKTLDAAPVIS